MESAFNRTVMVKKGGEEVRMTANEALFEKLFSMALAGDLRAARLLISLREKAGLSTATEAPVQLANLPPRAKTFDEWLINTGRKRADGSDPSEDDGSS
ncbi:MAG: hypothetical protein JJ922_02920 [Parvibaculum sp.]|nr:hypothetical protein [Parvibaculum sp.]MBO6690944.1 hypothetical protein [Parvibaculum sp.]MBO6713082.1 hypothetical protein [Parvibaculum sp.]